MSEPVVAFVTPPAAPRWARWLLFSPVARIVIFTALLVAFGTATNTLLAVSGWSAKQASPDARAWVQLLARVVPTVLAYLVLVKAVERRAVTELAARKILPDGALGIAAGLLLFSTVVGVLWLLGSYHVVGTNPHAKWLPALLTAGLGAGITEEIICRGVLYRIVEEGLGSGWALLISALLFGAAHLANPNATPWAALAIAIEAGLLFGLLYHLTRSLALCMGLHAAWNFAQGTIYGIPVSGLDADGWLVSQRTGPDWLSGGAFGAEASVVALALCSLCSLGLLVVAVRRGTLVRPAWRRR
jgi:membrane protease YdiL (CAAX protease family)